MGVKVLAWVSETGSMLNHVGSIALSPMQIIRAPGGTEPRLIRQQRGTEGPSQIRGTTFIPDACDLLAMRAD